MRVIIGHGLYHARNNADSVHEVLQFSRGRRGWHKLTSCNPIPELSH